MFVQVIRGRAKDAPGLRKQMDKWVDELRPGAEGFLGSTAGATDDGTFIAIARFSSEEEARRNSERPEQGEWWMETEKHLEGPVTFYDCPDAEEWMGGGSDDAGFVQVMIGRTTNRDRLREMWDESGSMTSSERPELIGGISAFPAGSTDEFISTAYFTSESEARAGERKTPSAEAQKMLDEWQSLMRDITYYDLTDPWMTS